jgi:hypothetical protein
MITNLISKSVWVGGFAALSIASSAAGVQESGAETSDMTVQTTTRQQALDYMHVFAAQIGDWSVTNWLMRSPGEYDEKHFVIRVRSEFDGLGLRSDWYLADEQGRAGAWFGAVIQTYNPASGEIEQEYFSGDQSNWIESRQVLELHDNGFGTSFSGADDYGPFDARTRTVYRDGDGFDWLIERRYPGTDWFVIDRGEARALVD